MNAPIAIINPNTTRSMTDKAVLAAQSVAAPGVEVVGYTSESGPAAIQGVEDGEAALPGLFQAVDRAVADGVSGIAIACFDDTGLSDVRSRVEVPVFGIGEAAYRFGAIAAQRFCVVTTLAVSIPVLEENIKTYGLWDRCARVRASGVPVLALEEAGSGAAERVEQEIRNSIAEDRCGAVVLGCAGMADLARDFTVRLNIPVIEGVSASVKLLEAFKTLALRPNPV